MSAQKLMSKWWQDNDRYIENPWTEINRLQDELKQMSITEAALREFLTGLSRESNEYRHKIETENAELRSALKGIILYDPLYKDDPWPKMLAGQALNKIS